MQRFEKVEKSLYRRVDTGILYVRKFKRGKGEISRSTGETTIGRAREIADQILSDWMRDDLDKNNFIFDEPALEVLEIMKSKAAKTYQEYETHLRLHLLPFFSEVFLSEIGGLWETYMSTKKSERPERKLAHDHKALGRILRHASRQPKYNFPVVPQLLLPESEKSPAQHKEFSNAELEAISNKASEPGRHKKTGLRHDLLVRTGMRDSERRLLKFEYIDRETCLITLPPNVCKNRDGRTYHLPKDLLERILTLRNPFNSSYVFPHRWRKYKGELPEGPSSKGWQNIRRPLGLEKRKRHFIRSTYVTRAIRSGAPAILVQKSVGMSDTVMKRIYLQANADDARKISQLVSESLQVSK